MTQSQAGQARCIIIAAAHMLHIAFGCAGGDDKETMCRSCIVRGDDCVPMEMFDVAHVRHAVVGMPSFDFVCRVAALFRAKT